MRRSGLMTVSITMLSHYAECRVLYYCYAECRYAVAECRSAIVYSPGVKHEKKVL
jgi:hypothetical protein